MSAAFLFLPGTSPPLRLFCLHDQFAPAERASHFRKAHRNLWDCSPGCIDVVPHGIKPPLVSADTGWGVWCWKLWAQSRFSCPLSASP
jgi:hypothetical protein